jgi:16S rRNA (guanine966-N2)-methyltransferase
MRITGGEAKGRLLISPKGMDIRPTSDRVREAIFNIIGHDLSGLKVLDLFAGTGSLGLEALSRSAKLSVFIDNAQRSIKIIKKNLASCGYQESGIILKRDLKKGISPNHPVLQQSFGLVFLDPPYGKNLIVPSLEKLSEGILSNEARVVAEFSKTEKLPHIIRNLEMADTRRYGDTRINIYEVIP